MITSVPSNSEVKISVEVESEKKEKKIDEWEVKCALETLIKAEEVKANKELMSLVFEKVSEQKQAITSVEGLRKRYKDIVKKELSEDKEE